MEFSITITSGMLFSGVTGGILFALSLFALMVGSFPDNPPCPRGNMIRWVCWPLLIIWIICRVIW